MSGMKKMDNKGFTLVEIMLSMAILALISIPLMKYFSDSLRYAAQTAEKQKATLIAQETVEFIKGQKKIVVEIPNAATPTPDPDDPDATVAPVTNYDLASELIYRFGGYATPEATGAPAKTPEVEIPDQFYATGATIDGAGASSPLVYRYLDSKSKKYYIEVKMNCITPCSEVESPAIMKIDDRKNVVVAERTEVMDAITHFSTLNINQYMAWNGGMLADPDMTPEPTEEPYILYSLEPDPDDPVEVTEYRQLTEAEIRANMDRIIYITITKGDTDDKFTVSAYYQFFCKDVFGPGTDSDMEYPSATICETTVETLDGIFLMFNKMSDTNDYIQVTWDVTDPDVEYPAFRFVVQDDVVTEDDLTPTVSPSPDPDAEPTDAPEETTSPEPTATPDPTATYNLTVDWYKFTSTESKPKVYSNLDAGNFTFKKVLNDVTKPGDAGQEDAYASDYTGIPVHTLTGSGVPVRIFDIEVAVYADEDAKTDGEEPLVTLKTTKVE